MLLSGSKSVESRKNRIFTEGWVEFTDKRVARQIASTLNNTQVGGKRRSPWYSDLWNIKYLQRFTWGLLNERLAYERAVHKSRLRTEVAIVKRETEHFARSVKQAKREKKQKSKNGNVDTQAEGNTDRLHEMNTDVTALYPSSQISEDVPSAGTSTMHSEQLRPKKAKDTRTNSDFMRHIFSGGFQK